MKPVFVLLLTLAAFTAMGYHPGYEDDGVYLAAIKLDLNPALYPHDADFVRLQSQATLFDECMAGFVRLAHLPVPWAELLVQLVSLYVILWFAVTIAQMLFPERRAQWAAVALLGAMFTLPVAGTAINIADQHLHPRTIATALILAAVERVLTGRRPSAVVLLVMAAVIHPIMAAFGISFCFFLCVAHEDRIYRRLSSLFAARAAAAGVAAFPMRWVFEPPSPEWRRALNTRSYYFLFHWTWYEWVGAIGPLVLFGAVWRWQAGKEPCPSQASDVKGHGFGRSEVPEKSPPDFRPLPLARFALALLLYGFFQQALAILLLASPALVRLTPMQPMRCLQLEYLFMVLIAGGLLGRHLLGRRIWRWALFLVAAYGGMFVSQRLLLPASEHLELPWRPSPNPWLQAFAWIRANTPPDAWFALDPNYLAIPGEDYHNFRALAERSQLADALKDAAVATQVPELAPRWTAEVDAQAGWSRFQAPDFSLLKSRFGVAWVLVSYPAPARLSCIWHNDLLAVCRIPDSTPP